MAIKINGQIQQFLYEQISEAKKVGLQLPNIDDEIISNLNQNKMLRQYQIDALEYTDHYVKNIQKNKQLHLLYHMATGSGKTIIMAALILYFYKRGYNSFVFFVNNANIIEKTKDNFLKKESSKYLFADNIILDGQDVEINEINTFNEMVDNKINIMFTTVQSLHEKIKLIKEDQLSLEDFENNKVILLADEAHHLNAEAKNKKTKSEDEEILSWEYTINQILASNKDSALLEFTATPDFKSDVVVKKYLDKVIYNYGLLDFRKDGYTKNFDNYQSGSDDIHRLLLAMLMSQYRKKLFAKNKMDVKPVILAKAKTTDDRDKFIERFLNFLNIDITENDIKMLDSTAEGYVRDMFDFYRKENISYQNLIDEFKLDFNSDHIITLDSSMSQTELQEKNRIVNDLENINNPYRLVIVVNMLNEGWDVLNLYDIVRLYEERDSKGTKIGKSTTQEAQLIGRGVRYYPFAFDENQKEITNKRKYDDDIESEFRVCETLLFHSKTDSKYLYELKEALKQQGMDIEDKVKFQYKLKDSFKMSEIYNHGFLFINNQTVIDNVATKVPDSFKFMLNRNFTKDDTQFSLVDDTKIDKNKVTKNHTKIISIKDFAKTNYNLIYKAMRKNFIKFDGLKQYIPNIKSSKEFILDDNYIGNFKVMITSNGVNPTINEYYETFLDFFLKLRKRFEGWKDTSVGTHSFQSIFIKDYIKDTKREKIHPDQYGEGISQNDSRMIEKYKLDLSRHDWYVYNDNYGTTEEKSFVKYFSGIADELIKKYDEVFLIRNERNLHIYSFAEGNRFEPDYILILRKYEKSSFHQKQIFIEPKGDHLLESELWKEQFLTEIQDSYVISVDDLDKKNIYSIYGLPFYNENNNIDEFDKALRKITDLD